MKSFREQYIECKKNKNAFLEECHHCGDVLIMCKVFGGQCISGKCKELRLQFDKDKIPNLLKGRPFNIKFF